MNNDWNGEMPDSTSSIAPYRLYNIGNSSPVKLMDFIEGLEDELGVKAKKNFLPMQPGDVQSTYADISTLERDYAYRPTTSVKEGIGKFIEWYKWFYKIS
jgi:UDP-glucuronate 4-epimerase